MRTQALRHKLMIPMGNLIEMAERQGFKSRIFSIYPVLKGLGINSLHAYTYSCRFLGWSFHSFPYSLKFHQNGISRYHPAWPFCGGETVQRTILKRY